MKILYIAHRIPFPPNKGDKIRSFNELVYLSKEHEIDLITFLEKESDRQYISELRKYCAEVYLFPRQQLKTLMRTCVGWLSGKPLSVLLYYSKSLREKTETLLFSGQYAQIVVFSGQMSQYVTGSLPQTTIDFCDVDSQKWQNYADRLPFYLSWFYRMEAERLLKFEKFCSSRCKAAIFITPSEKKIFEDLGGKGNLLTLSNGVDAQYFKPCKTMYIPYRILFTGAMDYFPNIDGVTWFANTVFPGIRSRYPSAEFVIAGSKPTGNVKLLGTAPGVTVTGFVEDMREELVKAHLVVVPLRIARGMQNKVLEALACGKAVCATQKSLGGIEIEHGKHLYVADSAEDISKAILKLFQNDDLVVSLGRQARTLVAQKYVWGKNLDKVLKIIFN